MQSRSKVQGIYHTRPPSSRIFFNSLGPLLQRRKKSLEKIQRKGARFVAVNYSYQHSVTSMLDDLNWPPLEKRRKIKGLTTSYKICNNSSSVTLPDYVKPSISRIRSHGRSYIQILANYEQYKNSFIPRTIREWNSLPPDLVHAESVDVFTTRLQTLTTWTSQHFFCFNLYIRDDFSHLLTSLARYATCPGQYRSRSRSRPPDSKYHWANIAY